MERVVKRTLCVMIKYNRMHCKGPRRVISIKSDTENHQQGQFDMTKSSLERTSALLSVMGRAQMLGKEDIEWTSVEYLLEGIGPPAVLRFPLQPDHAKVITV